MELRIAHYSILSILRLIQPLWLSVVKTEQEKTDPSCNESTVPGPSNHANERSNEVKGSADNSTEEILHERGRRRR